MTKQELKKLIAKAETLDLDDAARAAAPGGSFIALPCGNTHYELAGEGEAVVLVHGYVTPYYLYDKIYSQLLDAGYKVLRYDLLGRGLSERVAGPYDVDLFARQLDEITTALLGEEPFHLFGTSMGGSITTAFCAQHPGRARTLTLYAPAGMDTFQPPFYMTMCKIPVFGKWIFQKIGAKTIIGNASKELLYSVDERDDYIRRQAYPFQYKGIVACTWSSLVNTILNTKETVKNYYAVAKQSLPLLVVWGTNDQTMPYMQSERLKEICPQVQFVTFEGSGHIFLYDEGERTFDVTLPFLQEHQL